MARSRSRAGASRKPAEKRETKAKSRKKAPVAADIEVVEEEGGMNIDDGIMIMTTVLLLAAWLMTDYIIGTFYGKGIFFSG